MDPRLIKYYNRELQHIREMGGEFAAEFPKIAGRLGLDSFECADPYVERLLEGFAFLAARVQLKFDSEFPRFTQHLLETVYPHYLAPLPSMAVVQFRPDHREPNLAQGFTVPRGTVLRSRLARGEQTPCEFRTAHETKLWPVELRDASYLATGGDLAALGITETRGAKAGLRLKLATTANLTPQQTALDRLTIYLRGAKQTPIRIFEQILANGLGMVVRPARRPAPWQAFVDRRELRPRGLGDHEALLPQGPRSFSGHRLLQEYFAFPNRFLFLELGGLRPALQRCTEAEFEIVILFNRSDAELERSVDAGEFALHCTPAINLFPRRADRARLNDRDEEFHVVPDRARPMDFEVYAITGITGHGPGVEQRFEPFYCADDYTPASDTGAYYTVRRIPRLLSEKQRLQGSRSSYIGSEVFLSLVNTAEAPYNGDIREVSIECLCTNRDLALQMPVGGEVTDFNLVEGAPIEGVICVAGPTRPRPASIEGETHWRLINHLSLNYLSLLDNDERQGAAALRDLLSLYGDLGDSTVRKQVEGIRSVRHQAINRRLPSPGPITFGRGLEVTVTVDEAAFEGTGVFLLGAVLEQFFARYVALNSFTETVLKSLDRGEIMRWPTRLGRRHLC